MIILDTIPITIQKTLLEKMRMSGKSTTDISEPMSKNDLGAGNSDLSYLSARTIWARMISLTVPTTKKANDYTKALRLLTAEDKTSPFPTKTTPVVISGGQEITRELPSSLLDLGTPRSIGGKIRTDAFALDKNGNPISKDAVYDRDNYYRPMAGLKSINTEIKGGTKALKQTKVNWTCWDFKTLSALTPHFLHPGVTVAVEFGWMWPGHKPSEKVYENWMHINPDGLDNITEAVIEEGKGNQEMLYGIISNFNWTGRDDGGFDCTTTLVSPASNIFGESVGDTEKAETFEFTDTQKNQIRAKRSWRKTRETERQHFIESDEGQSILKETSAENKIDDKSIVNVPPRIFFAGLRDKLINLVWRSVTRNLNEKGKYDDTILTEKVGVDIDGQDDEYVGPYVSYGWFEDNILNRFIGRMNKKNQLVNYIRSVHKTDKKDVYQSVKIRNDSANLLTMNAQEVIIPGQFPFDIDFDEVSTAEKKKNPNTKNTKDKQKKKRKGMSKLASRVAELPNFSTKKVTKVTKKADPEGRDNNISEFQDLRKNAQSRVAKLTNEKSDDKREFGYLRNLLINVNIIEEEFVRANTAEDGLQNLLDRISASCGNIWDFKIIVSDDGFSASVQENNSNPQPVRDLLRNPSTDINTGLPKENYKHDGLLVFPTWRTNSIVHTQEMTSKIPSGMQTAVVYGRNSSEAEGLTKDSNQDVKGRKLGELFNIPGKELVEDNSLAEMERILGNDYWDEKGFGNNIQTKMVTSDVDQDFVGPMPEGPPSAHNNEGKVGPINLPNSEHRTDINTSNMLSDWTAEQIMKVLDDGIEHDKELKPEDGYSVGASNKKEYRFLYTNLGLLRKNYKSAMLYFLNNAPDSIENTSDILVPLEFSVTIDGTGGIHAGQCFTSTHIPKRYRDMVVFQIMSVSHQINEGSWKTTIKGMMRIDYGMGKGVNNNEQTDVKTMVDVFNAIKQNKGTDKSKMESGVGKPPYLSFSEYLTANAGNVGAYQFDLEKELESRKKDKDDVSVSQDDGTQVDSLPDMKTL